MVNRINKKGKRNRQTSQGGFCVCYRCGIKIPHEEGTPCHKVYCPKCGKPMVRGG